eukprot:TRINITY_DN44385_c0_g1_i1.p1 TRINITY_DN44385_c0_g1~~TRINITY_DN44385_c0_g1_i1.p1  ORF type:complete len:562 (-),score=69.34 TRINITY_DN44385_c0_g1_i1:238-1923(-)
MTLLRAARGAAAATPAHVNKPLSSRGLQSATINPLPRGGVPLWRSKLRRLRTLCARAKDERKRAGVSAKIKKYEQSSQPWRAFDASVSSEGLQESVSEQTTNVQKRTVSGEIKPCVPSVEQPDVPTENTSRIAKRARTGPRIQVMCDSDQEGPVAQPHSHSVETVSADADFQQRRCFAAQGFCRNIVADSDVSTLATLPAPKRAEKMRPLPPSTPPPSSLGKGSASDILDPFEEIQRILNAEEAVDILNITHDDDGVPTEALVIRAWKRLVLLLHPDKLHHLDAAIRGKGADALHKVHSAKDALRQQTQQAFADVPDEPVASGYRYIEDIPGHRKIEISWKLPEIQDLNRPIEKYEVWGPRYFSEAGDPFDWVMLATLPPLQSQFVIVEESPTQQDVMWAADRVLRPTLPLTVHAVNGRGASEALTLEVPWASHFAWLCGTPSVLCRGCLRLQPYSGLSAKCMCCGFFIDSESRIVARCHECQGELLWSQNGNGSLGCSCCLRLVAESSACRGPAPSFHGRSVPFPRRVSGSGPCRSAPLGGRGGRGHGGWGGRASGGHGW